MAHFKNISALCSVFKDTDPKEFELSLNSIINQSLPPKEIIIIVDGLISSKLEKIIEKYISPNKVKSFKLAKNKGLGNALRFGIKKCRYKIVARFDTDDVSLNKRFEKQLSFINKGWDMVTSSVIEYNQEEIAKKTSSYHIKTFSKINKEISEEDLILKNPVNHPSVMINITKMMLLNKNYNQNMRKHQDFLLWRELKFNKEINFKILHISDITVIMRSDQLLKKRSSLKSLKFEFLLFLNSLLLIQRFDLFIKLFLSLFLRICSIHLSFLFYKSIRTKFILTKNIELNETKEINSLLKKM